MPSIGAAWIEFCGAPTKVAQIPFYYYYYHHHLLSRVSLLSNSYPKDEQMVESIFHDDFIQEACFGGTDVHRRWWSAGFGSAGTLSFFSA